jgi:hypothetical protein
LGSPKISGGITGTSRGLTWRTGLRWYRAGPKSATASATLLTVIWNVGALKSSSLVSEDIVKAPPAVAYFFL